MKIPEDIQKIKRKKYVKKKAVNQKWFIAFYAGAPSGARF